MDHTSACVLLLLSSSAAFGKYVYIRECKTWFHAQSHCRTFHTDLAPISGEHDLRRLRRAGGDPFDFIWIGLVRNRTAYDKWTWSGGTGVSTFFWAPHQPQNGLFEDYGAMRFDQWHDFSPLFLNTFYCFNAVVVRQRKTWEDALAYCREHHRNLASVASETEMLLIKRELEKNETTELVWFGLHFFPGEWLWVDRQPLSYEAWGRGGRPACPAVQQQCAAIRRKGTTGNGSASNLPPDAGAAGVPDLHHSAIPPLVNIFGGTDPRAGLNDQEWTAHNCQEEFHFICY